ncbi:MAG: acyl-CoA thioesterase [Micavibrio aeruginosavorus]|uniref:Acyl-CoA thioesterase n=1 Tax=Micavibrio aeruginosavorus TaxID=349221 RepID=A0A7T5R4M9_9BACT|nr:MAG: acyl-CoA thioesterase [Micavibrio aeruginosavorus]
MVTEGLFTFVAIDAQRKPVEILTNNNAQNPVLVPPGAGRKAGAVVSQSLTPLGNAALVLTPDQRNTNALGDIFGGWLLSRMDDAASGFATQIAGGHRVANVALDAMTFHKPVLVGDEVTFYTQLSRLGKTSVSVNIEAWARRSGTGLHEKVTEGLFTYVAVDNALKPVPIGASPAP